MQYKFGVFLSGGRHLVILENHFSFWKLGFDFEDFGFI